MILDNIDTIAIILAFKESQDELAKIINPTFVDPFRKQNQRMAVPEMIMGTETGRTMLLQSVFAATRQKLGLATSSGADDIEYDMALVATVEPRHTTLAKDYIDTIINHNLLNIISSAHRPQFMLGLIKVLTTENTTERDINILGLSERIAKTIKRKEKTDEIESRFVNARPMGRPGEVITCDIKIYGVHVPLYSSDIMLVKCYTTTNLVRFKTDFTNNDFESGKSYTISGRITGSFDDAAVLSDVIKICEIDHPNQNI